MNINPENLINDPTNSFITNSHELVGGRNQKCKTVLEKISQKPIECQIPHIGEIMGDLAYELKNILRTDFPIFLDPKTASFKEVVIHAKIRQYLADSTIEKNLRYAIDETFKIIQIYMFKPHPVYLEEVRLGKHKRKSGK